MYCCVFFFFNDTATTEIYTSDTLFPYTTLFRSNGAGGGLQRRRRVNPGNPANSPVGDRVPLGEPPLRRGECRRRCPSSGGPARASGRIRPRVPRRAAACSTRRGTREIGRAHV